ncbi:MAG: zinc ribbon domain-containing protein [Acidobacteria bacterium]|nr:zinc ribbon domain-containing protein [Acidobacteriota bacterium]MCB9398116.1 zinc ribbon domain-containing protein [Acidobacteriota bacterium]
MPNYEYYCPENDQTVEVFHGMNEKVTTWGEVCHFAGLELGETDANTPVKKVPCAPGLSFPKTNSQLKNMGFTKLVKRETGVYENVTATGNEKRYMRADDPSSYPDLKRKIGD